MSAIDLNASSSQSLYGQVVSSDYFKLTAAIALVAGIILAGCSGAHGISQAAHIGLASGGTALVALGLVGLFLHWREKARQEILDSPLFKVLQVDPNDTVAVEKAKEWASKTPEERRAIIAQQQQDMLDSLEKVFNETSN